MFKSIIDAKVNVPVLRDNELKYLDSSELVVGDSVVLSASESYLIGRKVAVRRANIIKGTLRYGCHSSKVFLN